MATATIQRFSARYRLPADPAAALAAKARIAAPLGTMLDQQLEAALARLCLGEAIVLVRSVDAPVRLRAGNTEWQTALAWSEAIAAALERRLREADPETVQRFRWRGDAVLAFVEAALRQDPRRDWVWRQLDLLDRTGQGTVSVAARLAAIPNAIAAEPAVAAVVLRRLAEHGWLAELARSLDAGAVASLVEAVRSAFGVAVELVAGSAGRDDPAAPAVLARLEGRAFLAAIRAAGDAGPAWAVLAVLVLEAHRVMPAGQHPERLARCWLTAATAPGDAEAPPAPRRDRSQPRAPAPLPGRAADGAPARLLNAAAQGGPPRPAMAGEPVPEDRADATPVPEPDRAAFSAYGGLMLLMPVVAESGAGERLLDVEDEHVLRLRLHALALALRDGVADDDPAALAFAGLDPWGRPPEGEVERALIVAARDALAGHLAARLPAWARRARSRRRLLERVVDRPVRILFEPGWIQARFDLQRVDPDIRRAGLDLDPDFLPWLGLILKYRYV